MTPYVAFRPTGFDPAGLGLDDRQAWFVAPVSQTRDSEALSRSNFRVVLAGLRKLDPDGADHEVHRFGHWGPGWFELILVRPGSACETSCEEWEGALAHYPVACDSDFSELEQEEADQAWRDCYDPGERIAYIRRYRSQFEFRSFADMLGCVRGNHFAGYASELLAR